MRSSLLLAVVTLLALVACTVACPAPKDNRALSVSAAAPVFGLHDKQITLKVGQEFVIKLESNPTTGFTWMLKENQCPAGLEFLGCEYRRTPQTEVIVGSGGTDSWGFKAVTSGQIVLELQKVRPWVNPKPKTMDASFVITVE